MSEAQNLYKRLGFVERKPYYDTPVEGTVFFELDLS
jgi:ribosomal protein S18 acetylase RimI-like enzyme